MVFLEILPFIGVFSPFEHPFSLGNFLAVFDDTGGLYRLIIDESGPGFGFAG